MNLGKHITVLSTSRSEKPYSERVSMLLPIFVQNGLARFGVEHKCLQSVAMSRKRKKRGGKQVCWNKSRDGQS